MYRICVFFFIPFVFFSCAHKNEMDDGSALQTLQTEARKRKDETLWTKTLREETLSRDISHHDFVSESLPLTPDVFFVSSKSDALYPTLKGFAPLDDFLLSKELRSVLDNFVNSFSVGANVDALCTREGLASFVLFKNDFYEILQNKFSIEAKKTLNEKQSLFTKHLYAAPFSQETSLAVPLRLFFSTGFVDIQLYFEKDYRIQQCEIRGWRKADGT